MLVASSSATDLRASYRRLQCSSLVQWCTPTEVYARCTYEPKGSWFRGFLPINAPQSWSCVPHASVLTFGAPCSALLSAARMHSYCMPRLDEVYAACDFATKQARRIACMRCSWCRHLVFAAAPAHRAHCARTRGSLTRATFGKSRRAWASRCRRRPASRKRPSMRSRLGPRSLGRQCAVLAAGGRCAFLLESTSAIYYQPSHRRALVTAAEREQEKPPLHRAWRSCVVTTILLR